MAAIGDFLLASNKYIPCLVGSVFSLGHAAVDIIDNFCFGNLPLADEKVQKIFRECVAECGLNPNKYVCKVRDDWDSPASAVFPNIVFVSGRIEQSLEAELLLRTQIKHELGHLNHYDAIAATCLGSAATAALYGASWMMEEYLQDSSIGAIAAIAGIFIQLPLTVRIQRFIKLYLESRADQFAIKHTTNSQELRAVASYYEERFEDWVANLPTLQGGRSRPMAEFQNRENRNQILREWVIENRYMPLVAGKSSTHPNYYDRAQTFRLAGERLESSS